MHLCPFCNRRTINLLDDDDDDDDADDADDDDDDDDGWGKTQKVIETPIGKTCRR